MTARTRQQVHWTAAERAQLTALLQKPVETLTVEEVQILEAAHGRVLGAALAKARSPGKKRRRR